VESIVAIVKVMISVQNDVVIDPHYNMANERNLTFLNPIGKISKKDICFALIVTLLLLT